MSPQVGHLSHRVGVGPAVHPPSLSHPFVRPPARLLRAAVQWGLGRKPRPCSRRRLGSAGCWREAQSPRPPQCPPLGRGPHLSLKGGHHQNSPAFQPWAPGQDGGLGEVVGPAPGFTDGAGGRTGGGPESDRCAGVPGAWGGGTEGRGGRPRGNQVRPGAQGWVGGQPDPRSPLAGPCGLDVPPALPSPGPRTAPAPTACRAGPTPSWPSPDRPSWDLALAEASCGAETLQGAWSTLRPALPKAPPPRTPG